MAQRVITHLVSDLSDVDISDGDGRTVAFSIDGKSYTIDLTNDEAEQFAHAVKQYVDAATPISSTTSRRSSAKRALPQDTAAIREWAKANGFEVSERGRISTEVRDAYGAAH